MEGEINPLINQRGLEETSDLPGPSRVDRQLETEWENALRQGSFEAYKTIFEYYTPGLVKFARLSVQAEVAEEIVQDVMLNLWLRLDSLETRSGLSAYLFGAVKNRTANWIRHEILVRTTEYDNHPSHPLGMGEKPISPVDRLLEDETRTAVYSALQQLSDLQREVITLRWEEQLSYDEIASILSISVAAAKQNGSRAQRAIRTKLGDTL